MHKPRLPGDLSKEQLIDRILRVNHAGEFGAKRIYEGQLAILKNKPVAGTIRHMYEQELQHLAAFEDMLPKRKVRPTLLYPLWNAAGFVLGAATALLGAKAAMACTIAIEEVIDEHYDKQAKALADESEPILKQAIEKFRDEEAEHRDIGIKEGGEETPGYAFLSAAIKSGSRLAIWLSERI